VHHPSVHDEIQITRWLDVVPERAAVRRESRSSDWNNAKAHLRSNLAALPLPFNVAEQNHIVAAIEEHFSHLEAVWQAWSAQSASFTDANVSAFKPLLSQAHGIETGRSFGWPTLPKSVGRQRSPKNHTGPNMLPYLRAANVTWAGVDSQRREDDDFSRPNCIPSDWNRATCCLRKRLEAPARLGSLPFGEVKWKNCCFQNTLLRVRSKVPP